ncbi:MAG: ral secretion pathway protein [Pseudomonadota bacterium]|nr:ral secretion pathway protein [Pseudomonadota bacterium]
MAAFEYTALDEKGHEKKGVIESDSPRQARTMLRERGLMPLNIDSAATQDRKQVAGNKPVSRRGISATDLALFTRQLATLVRAALPLDEALSAVGQQTEKPRIQSMIFAIRARILEGHTLAAGLADFPRVFPELYRATVAAGEQSGHLDTVLDRLADYAESRQQMNAKITQASVYPAILTAVALMVVSGLLIFVVPKIVAVFETSGQDLPTLTRIMIGLSEFLQAWWWLLLIAVTGGVIGLKKFLQIPFNRLRYHLLLLRLPVIGRLVRGINSARFARTFSILIASGIPAVEALKLSAPVITNMPMRTAVDEAASRVREGSSIYSALQRSKLFPPMTLHLIASGERSGNLQDMLEKAAQQQERELETLIAMFMGLFEPLLIVLMGGIVLVIVLSILLPIINMNDLMQ